MSQTNSDTVENRQDKDKQDDTDARIEIAKTVCDVLQKSTWTGPARTCHVQLRHNFRYVYMTQLVYA